VQSSIIKISSGSFLTAFGVSKGITGESSAIMIVGPVHKEGAEKTQGVLAKIPYHAMLITSPAEGGAQDNSSVKGEKDARMDLALIPRLHLLDNIVGFLCPTKEDSPFPSQYNNCVRLTLRGMGGLGKTTLAAMAVSTPKMRSVFDHIIWLDLGRYFKTGSERNNLDYEMYLDCAKRICRQIDAPINRIAGGGIFFQPGDGRLMRAAKVMQAIEQLKLDLSGIIDKMRILVVLDDVWSHEDVELFNLGRHTSSRFAMLLTTRTVDPDPAAGSMIIEVGLLDENEAGRLFCYEADLVNLFLHEADIIYADVDKLVCRITYAMGNLPLAIRMAGRHIRTRKMMEGDISFYQIAEAMLSAPILPELSPAVRILDQTFSFVTNVQAAFALKFFFAAFVSVFCRDDVLRPWVNIEAVELLWKGLHSGDMRPIWWSISRDYKLNKIDQIAEVMCTMGIFDNSYEHLPNQVRCQRYIRVHHDLMFEYGNLFSSRVNASNGEPVHCTAHGVLFCNACPASANVALTCNNAHIWNSIIVRQFQLRLHSKRITSDCCDSYMRDWLPLHMIRAGQLNEALSILSSKEFLVNQMSTGIEEGTRTVLAFLRSYKFAPGHGGEDYMQHMVGVITVMRDCLRHLVCTLNPENCAYAEMGRGLILLGVEIQTIPRWAESIDYFTEALGVFRATFGEDSDAFPDVVKARGHVDSCVIRHVNLVSRDSPDKLLFRNAGAILDGGSVGGKGVSLELCSHPGYAVVRMTDKFKGPNVYKHASWSICHLGIGPSSSALTVHHNGQYIRSISDNSLMFASMCSLVESNVVFMRSSLNFKEGDAQEEENIKCMFTDASLFTVGRDGTIGPTGAPNLCLGILQIPGLYLVSKDSPNKAYFKNSRDLKQSGKSNEENSLILEKEGGQNVNRIRLELSSHPNMAVVAATKMLKSFQNGLQIAGLGLGPSKDSLSAELDEGNKIKMTGKYSGMSMCVTAKGIDAGHLVFLSTVAVKRGMTDEVMFNLDGTISSQIAPHLVLGFQVPGSKYI